MRIYVPIIEADRPRLRSGAPQLPLEEGRPAWALTVTARRDRDQEDPEDLEYDALQDAVFAALVSEPQGDPARRAIVVAGDVPDGDLVEASEGGGAYGVVTASATTLRIASLHVTELGARAIDEDDTDPALLWFDRSEGATALEYAARDDVAPDDSPGD